MVYKAKARSIAELGTAVHEIYLDNNATTLPLPGVVEAVSQAMSENYGNPSSPHQRGDIARRMLIEARQRVATLVGCAADGLIFTSGGTEANNLVLQSFCRQGRGTRLITSAIEHSSVLKVAESLEDLGAQIVVLGVDAQGRISPDSLDMALEQPADLVSIQWANSETGTLQQTEKLGQLCQSRGVPFHVDAAQAVGRLPIDMKQLPVSYLTFTAHKIHGPQGVGAVAANARADLVPLLQGGDQEGGIRAGTENLPGINGFGVAAQLRQQSLTDSIGKLRHLRDTFEQKVLESVPQAQVNGAMAERVANSTNILLPNVDGMAMMARLDSEGICCSLTSACVSSRPEPSHVLLAMGLSEEDAYSSIRFSFSILNTDAAASFAASKVGEIYQQLAGLEPLASMQV